MRPEGRSGGCRQCVIDQCRLMALSLSSESDSEGDLCLLDKLQDSEDNEMQSEGFISDSGEEYLPENDSEAPRKKVMEVAMMMRRHAALHCMLHCALSLYYLIPLLTNVLVLFRF